MSAQKQEKPETMQFQAEVSRLLDIVTNALYSNRDVFLRELISNAADACDRLRYEALQNSDLIEGSQNFKIKISFDTNSRTLTIEDNGIGMNRDDLIENLGTIARSGTAKIMEQLKESQGSPDLIGQFGVGFYASFMAADKVEVLSKKAGEKQSWAWSSDGHSGFEISEANTQKETQGTRITLYLKDNAGDYLLADKLRVVIEKYSDHIDIPVYLNDEEAAINKASALWARSKSEISKEDYTQFYQSLTMGMDEPTVTAHWKAEGKIEYTALLYIPTLRPFDLFAPQREHAVKLYVKRVFITDQCEGLVYPWLRFIRGVIDSADLPLNISREVLQANPLIVTIREAVTKRILKELSKLAEKDAVAFNAFWMQFGMVLKEGLYDALEHREAIFDLCRFYSSEHTSELTSLKDYVENMKEGQKTIYYISGENVPAIKNSPQLEGFKSRGINVLFMLDTIDEFWLQQNPQYKDFTFKSVTRGAADLKDITSKENEAEEDKSKENTLQNDDLKPLLETIKNQLKEDVEDVILSNRLTESAVCFVVAEGGVDMQMEKVLRIQQKYNAPQRRILEINPDHALIQKLAQADTPNPETIWMLLDQAKILQGEPVKDPAAFAKRLNALLS